MSKLVTIIGGSGFVGRYVARRMAIEGWRVRVAVRRPNEALFVRPYGVVGQVEPVPCNIRDDASVRAALMGADAVVNCVGTFDARGRNNFDAVQAQGAAPYGLLAEREPVAGADLDLNSRITLKNFKTRAQQRFALLDPDGRGYLLLNELPKTQVQRQAERAKGRPAPPPQGPPPQG